MKRKNILLLSVFCCSCITLWAGTQKVDVYSDGDHGLELDWAKSFDCDVSSVEMPAVITDVDGNLYVAGRYKYYVEFDNIRLESSSNTQGDHMCPFVAKFAPDGELQWTVNLTGHVQQIGGLYFTPDGELVIFAYGSKATEKNVLFNGMAICSFPTTDSWGDFLVKCDKETGAFMDVVKLGFQGTFSIHNFYQDHKGDFYYWTLIDEEFTSLDNERLPTSIRTKGYDDHYIAKISPDFQLIWDFSLGGTGYEDPEMSYELMPTEPSGSLVAFLLEDTLFIKASYFSESMDIDPNPQNEVLVYNNIFNSAVLAKYLISEEQPKLLNYVVKHTNDLPHLFYANSKNEMETYFGPELTRYRFNTTDLTWQSLDSHCPHHTRDVYGWYINNIYTSYFYDKTDNFMIFNNLFQCSLTLPSMERYRTASITFSEEVKDVFYSMTETEVSYLAKYNPDYAFQWAIVFKYIFSPRALIDTKNGNIYVCGQNSYAITAGMTVDWNPDVDKITAFSSPNQVRILTRYTETYRIKPDAELTHGSIITPEKFTRHGDECDIGVIADEGYEVESVFTLSGKLLQKSADGKYVLENVMEPEIVSAVFRKKITGTEEVHSKKLLLYPNPATDVLYLNKETTMSIDHIEVYDVSGRFLLHQQGDRDNIRIDGLSSGIYYLRIKDSMGYMYNQSFTKK